MRCWSNAEAPSEDRREPQRMQAAAALAAAAEPSNLWRSVDLQYTILLAMLLEALQAALGPAAAGQLTTQPAAPSLGQLRSCRRSGMRCRRSDYRQVASSIAVQQARKSAALTPASPVPLSG